MHVTVLLARLLYCLLNHAVVLKLSLGNNKIVEVLDKVSVGKLHVEHLPFNLVLANVEIPDNAGAELIKSLHAPQGKLVLIGNTQVILMHSQNKRQILPPTSVTIVTALAGPIS